MIYLDGDNDLEKYAINDFLEIASVGSTEQVNLIVQFDRISGYDTRYGNWTNTQRFRITRDMEPTVENAINNWGDGLGGREVNSGDPESLSSFVIWAKQNFPAENYALILWDHGDGWRSMNYTVEQIENQLNKPGLSREEKDSLRKLAKELRRKIHARRYQKSVCFDNTSFDELTLKEISQALSNPDSFADIIAFDACLMGMFEVAYEIRNCATYMIASEETIYTTGFPYDLISQDLVNNSYYQPEQFAEKIVLHYETYYGTYGTETLSAINLSFAQQVFDAINSFCQTAIFLDNQWLYLYIALSQTPVFDDPDYKDMKSFFEGALNNVSNQDLINQTENLLLLLDTMITANFGEPKGKGLSIYIPDKSNGIDPAYNPDNLSFALGLWKTFLQTFYDSDISKGFTVLINEGFDSGLPDGWTVVDGNNDGKTWTSTNPKNRYIQELTEPFMIADSDWAGRFWMDEQLITKPITVDGSKRIFLVFDHFFNAYGSEIADIDIKVDSGLWQNMKRYQYQDTKGTLIIPVYQYISQSEPVQIQIRWNYYNAYDAWYWAIDNVRLLMEGIKLGDINGDSIIDISDVILCLRMAISLDPADPDTADMNEDGSVDISDVILILRKAVGLD